jgi:putative transposase
MTISNELLDELMEGCKRPEDLLGDAGRRAAPNGRPRQ